MQMKQNMEFIFCVIYQLHLQHVYHIILVKKNLSHFIQSVFWPTRLPNERII